jgi:hypothetical protein
MMMKLRTLLMLSALTLTGPALAGGALALADNAPANNTPANSPAVTRPDRPSPAVMQHLVDGRIAFIETALNLSGDQQKLWQPVADLLRQDGARHEHGDRKPGDHQASLSDMLSQHAQSMTKRAAFDQQLASALKSLEASLTPEQQQTLKIAFFQSMPHMQHRPMQGGFKPNHEGSAPQAPDDAPATNG